MHSAEDNHGEGKNAPDFWPTFRDGVYPAIFVFQTTRGAEFGGVSKTLPLQGSGLLAAKPSLMVAFGGYLAGTATPVP